MTITATGLSATRSGRTILHPTDVDIRPGERVQCLQRGGWHVGRHPFGYRHRHRGVLAACAQVHRSGIVGQRAQQRAPVPLRQLTLFKALHIQGGDLAKRPWGWSRGMQQRFVIAMALIGTPDLLVMDEPTSALDPVVAADTMDLLDAHLTARAIALLLITHDLGLASQYCDRIVVRNDGLIVDEGAPGKLFTDPLHAYTRKLVDATPRLGATIRNLLPPEARSPEPLHTVHAHPLLQVRNLVKTYPGKASPVHAVKGISFDIKGGQSLGLVGESGSGKSTTSEMIVRLQDPTSGTILFDGQNIASTPSAQFMHHAARRDIQMVFQDATDSLNPRSTAASAIAEPLARIDRMRGAKLDLRVAELADLVGLPQPLLSRFPHQLSGGQKARVGIARAIALEPKLLILDEPTAALDVSIQALVLNLLVDLRAQMGMSYLFVSHDLNVVRLLCDEVLVMKQGEIVDHGPTAREMDTPTQPYTRALIEAAPQPPEPVAA